MRSDWPNHRLGDLCLKVGSGATPRGGSNVYIERGVRFIRSQNVHDLRFEWSGLAHIDDQAADQLRGVAVHPGDVLVNITGDSVARVCLAPDDGKESRVSQHVAIVRPDETGLHARFATYWLVSPSVKAHLMMLASAGATRKALTKDMLEGLELPLPSIEEQRRIVAILSALDDKIDSNRRLGALLDETAATVFRARFVDFVGVEEFDDSDIGRVPRGWAAGPLSALVEITMGQSPPGSSYADDQAAGLLLVQGMGGFGTRYPVSRVYTSAPTRTADAGATLMTVRAPVGAVNVARTQVCLGRGVCGMTSNCQAFTEFLIRSLQGRWASEESGTIFPAVNKAQVASVHVVIPPPEQIRDFEKYAAPIVGKLLVLHDETDSLVCVRDALLPKLISGEIRVPDSHDPEEVIGPVADRLAAATS